MSKCWLVCSRCERRQPFALRGKCRCGGTLLVAYDLELAGRTMTKEELTGRTTSMWRYLELLPVRLTEAIVTLGEGGTPLLRLPRAEKRLALREIYVKREEQNPTGSFKARGFSAAVSLLKERGIHRAAVPSNGNAASAFAAYAARGGLDAYVFVPRDCPRLIVEESMRYGAQTYIVDGLIHNASALIEEGRDEQGWFHVGTLREPGRVEGKKTMGLELAEQLGWRLPDVIVYPTGGGSGIIGLWKAFRELREMGLAEGPLPRFVSVQEAGCQPIVDAVAAGERVRPPAGPVESAPTGLRVPQPPDGDLIAEIIRRTDGTAVAVSCGEIESAAAETGREGLSSSPEGAAAWAGLLRLRSDGWLEPTDRVVVFNTAHALKYAAAEPSLAGPPLVRSYADVRRLLQARR
ncbi:threonine synthase [Paenibacillus sp. J31TS4]|uniref:threonine synthase n=1 Tax=Paenibacillus sp. J31TS4 TaxID=2807195 RepID=UPI001B0F563C|nr:threonine synthase [Paenibacillus sp. J31TS4]GIP37712.1 threonine synthase [Paenibacillus sp. J31TS4]